MLGLAPARQRDQAHLAPPGFAANRARDVVARHLGHADVEQHDVGTPLPRERDGGAPVVGGEHFVARRLQEERQAVGAVLAVVGDEDASTFANDGGSLRHAPARAATGDGQRQV